MNLCKVCIQKTGPAIVILVISLLTLPLNGQEEILDSLLSFSSGTVKTAGALNIISRKTGYYFTYDSRIVNRERRVTLDFYNTRLRDILNKILGSDSLAYSVVNRYIIIYKPIPEVPVLHEKPDWEIKDISGRITDSETGEPIPYANIGIPKEARGTVANSNGEFVFKISGSWINDTIIISHIGYHMQIIPVSSSLDKKLNIRMTRVYVPIPEIIIRNQVPQEIIRKAYTLVAKNYGTSPANLTAFYREAVLKRSELQIYSEAILEIYKSSYTSFLPADQVKIIRSRKIENLGLRDTLTIRLRAGLYSCLELDGVRNTFDFIEPGNFDQYNYRMTDIVRVGDGAAYVIEFDQKPDLDFPLYRGSLYINTSSYAIEQAEFEINPVLLKKRKDDFITYQSKGYTVMPTSVKYTVTYKNTGGRYFLSHVRGDLNFSAREKKKLFSTGFLVFFEMAVTDINTENVTRFERDETAPLYSVFSRTIKSYDAGFWGDFDFLKPESDLLRELKNMKIRLQEFQGDNK